MTGLTPAGEAAVLSAIYAGTVYASLHTGDPGTGNTGANEVTGGSYARQAATFTQTGSNPTVASNSATITFPAATASWGTIGYFAIWDAASGGNMRGSGVVSPSKPVNSGDTARFLATTMTITAD